MDPRTGETNNNGRNEIGDDVLGAIVELCLK
jgi:hypothetical protein